MIRIDNRSYNLLSAKCEALHLLRRTHVKSHGLFFTEGNTRRVPRSRFPNAAPGATRKTPVPSKVHRGLKFWPRGTRSPKSGRPRETRLSRPQKQRSNPMPPRRPPTAECRNQEGPERPGCQGRKSKEAI